MKYLLDTNILIHLVRENKTSYAIEQQFNLFSHRLFFSAVSKGEILSIAKQSRWGLSKMSRLHILFNSLNCYPIDGDSPLMDAYADIDTYSQGKHLSYPPPRGFTSRNMGKNDLWIAATAFLLDLPLITTDNDFDHLHPHFVVVHKV